MHNLENLEKVYGAVNGVIRLRDVSRMTGLAKSTIYALIKADDFPKQVKLGKRAVGWWYLEVIHWLSERPR